MSYFKNIIPNLNSSLYNEFNGKVDPKFVGQCVGYVKGRVAEVGGKTVNVSVGSGGNMVNALVSKLGYVKLSSPKAGAIISLMKTANSDGHVIMIENVSGETLHITQANKNNDKKFNGLSTTTLATLKRDYPYKVEIGIDPKFNVELPSTPTTGERTYINCPDGKVSVWNDVQCKSLQDKHKNGNYTIEEKVSWINQKVHEVDGRKLVEIHRSNGKKGYVVAKALNGDTYGRTISNVRLYN